MVFSGGSDLKVNVLKQTQMSDSIKIRAIILTKVTITMITALLVRFVHAQMSGLYGSKSAS